jgi:hypothetical protein
LNTILKGRLFENLISCELKAVGYDIVGKPPPTTRWQKHVDFGPTTVPDAGIDLVGYKHGKFRLVQCKNYNLYPKMVSRLKEALGRYWAGLKATGSEVWLIYRKPGGTYGRGNARAYVKAHNVWERCV